MLIRDRGLELPVYPWWTRVAWNRQQMRQRANSGTEEFVRRVSLRWVGATSLKGALQEVDETFNRLAEHADLGVVEHSWGLYRGRPPREIREYEYWRLEAKPEELLPAGHYLVALVANLAPLVEPDSGTRGRVISNLNDFRYNDAIPGPKLRDTGVSQVGFHVVQAAGVPVVRGDIMDIDAVRA